jgi:multicomponent Na+:H+ antiporter subunit F
VTSSGLLEFGSVFIYLVLAALALALLLAFVRLVRGPSLPDRVVALELMTGLTMGLIAMYAIVAGQRVFLDVAVVLALITFLGTVAFSRYLERRARGE